MIKSGHFAGRHKENAAWWNINSLLASQVTQMHIKYNLQLKIKSISYSYQLENKPGGVKPALENLLNHNNMVDEEATTGKKNR